MKFIFSTLKNNAPINLDFVISYEATNSKDGLYNTIRFKVPIVGSPTIIWRYNEDAETRDKDYSLICAAAKNQ